MDIGNVSKLISRFEQLSKSTAEKVKRIAYQPPQTAETAKATKLGKTIDAPKEAEGNLHDNKIKEVSQPINSKMGGVIEEHLPSFHAAKSVFQKGEIESKTHSIKTEIDKLTTLTKKTGNLNEIKLKAKQISNQLAENYFQAKTPEERNTWVSLASDLSKSLAGENLKDLKKDIDLEQKVAHRLIHHFSASELQPTLKQTLSSIALSHHLSDEDIKKEAKLIDKDPHTAMLKMTSRLITYREAHLDNQTISLAKRMDMTGYELSVIKQIDKNFRNIIKGKPAETTLLIKKEKLTGEKNEAKHYIALIQRDQILVEEQFRAAGSSKACTLSSNFFQMKSQAERRKYVTLKPTEMIHPIIMEEIKQAEMQMKNMEKGSQDVQKEIQKDNTENNQPESSGTFQVKSNVDGKLNIDLSTQKDNDDMTFNPESSGTFQVKSNVDGKLNIDLITNIDLVKVNKDNEFLPLSQNQSTALKDNDLSIAGIKKLNIREMRKLLNKYDKEPEHNEFVVMLREQINIRQKEIDMMFEFHNTRNEKDDYEHEIKITKELQGPGIVKMHSIMDLGTGDKIMVQEAAGIKLTSGKIANTLQGMSDEDLTETEFLKLCDICQDAFESIRTMHSKGLIHRDLKGDNILITKDGHGVLTDFGSVAEQQDDPRKSELAGTTPYYAAPEIFKYTNTENWNLITEKCDVWSCGMILQQTFNGGIGEHPAIQNRNIPALMKHMISIDPNLEYPKPDNKMSLQHLIWSATQINPDNRPDMATFCARFAEINARLQAEFKSAA